MSEAIRILVADDHPIVRNGLRMAIDADPWLTVVGEAANGQEALARIQELTPAIAVLDIDMPKLDGFGVAREVRKERLPVKLVFLTMHSAVDLFDVAMDLGASGYILKESAMTEIVQGLKAVSAGQHYVSPALTSYLIQRLTRTESFEKTTPGLGDLTQAERKILQMIAAGKTSKEIGTELFIHHRTVENHRLNICQKLGITGPHALLKFAMQHKGEL